MAADNEINAKLNVETKKAVDNVDDLGDSFDEVADDAEEAEDSIKAFADKLDSMGSKMQSIGGALTLGVTAPILGVATAAVSAGLNAVEAESLFETSFGNMADEVRAWSLETSDALGLSEFELRRQSATMFTMTESMGLSREAAGDMAKSITVLAGDMASFFNSSPEEAFNKLRSGITGEAEPLKQLGILVTENFVKQTDFAKAILATGRELTEQEKVMARYHAILEQTSTAQGDLARTAESPANRLRAMGSSIEDATTKLGLALIPAVEMVLPLLERLVEFVEDTVEWFSNLDSTMKMVIVGVVGMVAAIGPMIAAFGTVLVAASSVATAWGTLGVGALTVTGVLGALGTFITGTLLPLLGALAAGILLGGAIGIAVSEFLEWLGVIESTEEKTRQLLETMGPSEQDIRLMADASVIAGEKITDWGEAIRIVNENNMKLRDGVAGAVNITAKLAAESEAATAAAEEQAAAEAAVAAATLAAAEASKKATLAREAETRASKILADQLGTAGLVASAEKMQRALDELNRRGEALSSGGLDKVLKKMADLRAEGIELTGTFADVDQKFKDFTANVAVFPPLVEGAIDLKTEMEGIDKELGFVNAEMPKLAAGVPLLDGLGAKTVDWGAAMSSTNDFLSKTRGLFDLIGVSSDSWFSKALEGASALFDKFNSLTGILSKIGGFFGIGGGEGGSGGGIFGGLASKLGGLFGGGGASGGVTASLSAGAGLGVPALTTGVASGGATAGTGFLASFSSSVSSGLSSLGSTLAPLFTNPFTIGIGAAIGGFLLIKKFFGGESGQEQAGRIVGENFGTGISDELAKAISEAGGGKTANQAGLFLKEIFAEGSQSADDLAKSMADVSQTSEDIFSTAAGLESIGKVAKDLSANFDALGASGTTQVERLLRTTFDAGTEFEGMNQIIAQLGTSLVDSAAKGGDAWLNATNEIGTTGRESLAFLRNAYGEELPESVLASINSILGLNAAVNETAGGANKIGEEFAALPEVAAEAVGGIKTSFEEGANAITEGLQPVSELMANEIREAGESTSAAIDQSFASTNAAIKGGLGEIASTFVGEVAAGASAAAAATDRITAAANRAAAAARQISFPDIPGGDGGNAKSAAKGMRGVLGADTLIQAHKDEFVNIIPADETRRMDFRSAQNGMGPGASAERKPSISMGDTTLVFQASGNRKEDDQTLDRLLSELSKKDGRKRKELQRMLGVKP